jgi:hypothetical protein
MSISSAWRSAWRSGGRGCRVAGWGGGLAGWGEAGTLVRANAASTWSRPAATGAAATSGTLPGSAAGPGTAAPSSEGALPFVSGTADAFSSSEVALRQRAMAPTHQRASAPCPGQKAQHLAWSDCAARVARAGCRGGGATRQCRLAWGLPAARSHASLTPAPFLRLPMRRPCSARSRCRNNPQQWP